MDQWAAVAEERRSLVGTFEGLTDEQWATPSLCGEWTVRQVLGHLVAASSPLTGRFARELVRARGSFDRANARVAREEAERPVAELLADYRVLLTKRASPPGFGAEAPLTDALLHGLDVRLPLGLPTERPVEHHGPAMELLCSRRAALGFVPRGRPALRWVATDLDWSHGTGPEVEGTMADLMLAASGRRARLDALTGSGAPALAAWLGR